MTDTTMYADFHAAYSDMSNPKKNAANPAFRSKYANLEELLAVTRKPLDDHGFALVQEPVNDGDSIGVHTRLIHRSGDSLDFGSYVVPLAKHDAQGAGSALTYTRRYAIAAVFGLAQEDDDGNAASRKADPKHEPKLELVQETHDAGTEEAWKELVASYTTNGSRDAVMDRLGAPKSASAAYKAYLGMTDTERNVLKLVADGVAT